jgi:cytoskeleton protein RodZ
MAQPSDIPESFGAYLKRERELREIPLDEIAAYTRIKLRALEAIERDDFASLPALAFMRAFIRCYADYIGLNVPDVMLRFDAFVQNRYPELTGEVPIIQKKKPPRQRYVPLALAIVAVLLIALSYWLKKSPHQEKPAPVPAEQPAGNTEPRKAAALPPTSQELGLGDANRPAAAEVMPAPSPEASPAGETHPPEPGEGPAPAEPSAPWTSISDHPLGPPLALASPAPAPEETRPSRPAPKIKHTLTITVNQPCWIQYLIDNDPPRQTILQPDQTVTFAALSSVKINVGNPDGVSSVTYNDQPFKFEPKCSPWWLNFPAGPNDNPCPTRGGR